MSWKGKITILTVSLILVGSFLFDSIVSNAQQTPTDSTDKRAFLPNRLRRR